MKVKVLKEFIDKNTRELHRIEDIVEYPLERAQELIDGEWVEEIKEEPILKPAPKKNSPRKSRGSTK